MKKRARLFDRMREAQRHVDEARDRLTTMPLGDPRWDATYAEYQSALQERSDAEKAHGRRT